MTKPRRYPRYAYSYLTSLVNEQGDRLSGYIVDLGWGGVAVRLRRRPYAPGLPFAEGEPVRLGVVDPAQGTFHMSGLVRWVRPTATQIRIGLELRQADPAFYGLVQASMRRT